MTARPENDDGVYIGAFFEWINEWRQVSGGYNWRTFHPVMVEVEDDRSMGGVEMTLVLLGLGFRARWNYAETETITSMKRQLDELQADLRAPDRQDGEL